MYDELIKSLRICGDSVDAIYECCSEDCIYHDHPIDPLCMQVLCNKAADAIEELSKREDESIPKVDVEIIIAEVAKPRWIPVTEKLPDALKEVYVTDGEYIARANLLDEVFPGDQPCWSYSGLGEITHWCEKMPLPEPPKEE